VVTANNGFGFSFFDKLEILQGQNLVKLNDIISNGGSGIEVNRTRCRSSLRRTTSTAMAPSMGSNCGISVQQNSASAINNYWGTPQGPGRQSRRPGGRAATVDGTIPNNDAGLPVTKPFATQPFGVL